MTDYKAQVPWPPEGEPWGTHTQEFPSGQDHIQNLQGFPGDSVGKESTCKAGGSGSIPGSGRSPGEGNGNSLQYSWLGNPRDREAWWATVHGVTKSQTRLEWLTQHNSTLLQNRSKHWTPRNYLGPPAAVYARNWVCSNSHYGNREEEIKLEVI